MKVREDFGLRTGRMALFLTTLLCLSGLPRAQAITPVGGWGYSLGYAADRLLGVITPQDDLWSFWVDPPPAAINSGQVTLFYNPSLFTVKNYGWVGDFGADPSIPAPPVTPNEVIPTLDSHGNPWTLQAPNANLVTHTVTVDPVAGKVTVDFDWGANPHQPTTTADSNFFGLSMSVPPGLTGFQFVPRGTGDFGLVGSPQDVAANGNNAATYLACSGGYCGSPPMGDLKANIAPEPSPMADCAVVALFAAGLILTARKRKTTS